MQTVLEKDDRRAEPFTPNQKRVVTKLMLLLSGCALALLFLSDETDPLMKWAHRHDEQQLTQQLRPAMEPLAKQGKPDAIIWMATHGQASWQPELQKLADKGNTQAMLAIAQMKWNVDHSEATRLLRAAAEAGNPTALQWKQRLKL